MSNSLILKLWPVSLAGFLTLAGYEFTRSPSVTLFQKHYGPSATPWLITVLPFFTFLVFYLNGKSLTRFGTRRTLVGSTLISSLLLLLSYFSIQAGFAPASIFLYLLRESYIVLIIEQCWAVADSILTPEEAKKSTYLLTGFTSIGGVIGGAIVGHFAVKLGTGNLVLIGALLLLPVALGFDFAYRRNSLAIESGKLRKKPETESEIGFTMGWGILRSDQRMWALLWVVVFSQLLSTSLGLLFQAELYSAFPNPDEQTAFSGRFYSLLNATAMIFQFFLGPLLFSRMSIFWSLAVVPFIHFGMAMVLGFIPGLYPVGFAFLLFKALDYSLFKATKERLFVGLPYDGRYRTKGLIDGVAYRTGKGAGSVVFSVLGMLGAPHFPMYRGAGLLIAFLWSVVAFRFPKEASDSAKN